MNNIASKQPNFDSSENKFNKPTSMADITKIQTKFKNLKNLQVTSKISKIPQKYNRHSPK